MMGMIVPSTPCPLPNCVLHQCATTMTINFASDPACPRTRTTKAIMVMIMVGSDPACPPRPDLITNKAGTTKLIMMMVADDTACLPSPSSPNTDSYSKLSYDDDDSGVHAPRSPPTRPPSSHKDALHRVRVQPLPEAQRPLRVVQL